MYLTAEEQEDLVDRAEVSSEGYGERRWVEGMGTVVRADNGRLYRITWDRALTENQENEFTDGDVPEVFAADELKVKTKRLYLTAEEEQNRRPTLAQKIVDEADSYQLATGKDIREPISEYIYDLAVKLQDVLVGLAPLDLAADSGDYRRATEQYLAAIITLKERNSR